MDTLTIQCFLALADTGSFTRAARRVHRTQSAVSQQIAKLEAQLGKTLIDRGSILSLTAEGEIFLGYARQLDALHMELIERFKEPELSGEVRFGLPEDFATCYLSDVLLDFVRIHPRILLNIECDLTLNLLDRFKRGEFDLVLVKMSRPEDFAYGQEVWSEQLEWVGSPGLLLDQDKPLNLVLSPSPCVYRATALQALENAGIRWRLAFTSPSYAGTMAAVKAGLGVTVLPRTMIPAPLTVLTDKRLPKLSDTHVSLLKRDQYDPAILSFEQFVTKMLKH